MRVPVTDRQQTEQLVEAGSWVDGFQASRLRQSDGTILDYVKVDPALQPKVKRIWVFFWRNGQYTTDMYIERCTANWRRWNAR